MRVPRHITLRPTNSAVEPQDKSEDPDCMYHEAVLYDAGAGAGLCPARFLQRSPVHGATQAGAQLVHRARTSCLIPLLLEGRRSEGVKRRQKLHPFSCLIVKGPGLSAMCPPFTVAVLQVSVRGVPSVIFEHPRHGVNEWRASGCPGGCR